jgi:putative hydrolases of HD superfamily
MRNILAALSQIGCLKELVRSGWLREGISQPESVADHSFRTALLALALGPELGVNVEKLVKMLLVHDLGESDPRVGDITPFDGISLEEKHRLESTAMEHLCSNLPNGVEMLALWRDYEAGQSAEAIVAKQFDTFEMVLQAFEYEKKQGIDLGGFREQARNRLHLPILLEMYDLFSTCSQPRVAKS